jgi:hypothetical protein
VIRITQTFAIREASKFLRCEGWEIIYQDFPGARRSGVGRTAAINLVLEHLYDMSPDFLAVRDGVLLIGEADRQFSDAYVLKFAAWERGAPELLRRLSTLFEAELKAVRMSFVSYGGRIPVSVKLPYPNILLLHVSNTGSVSFVKMRSTG